MNPLASILLKLCRVSRSARSRPFSARERRLVQSLLPHLVGALLSLEPPGRRGPRLPAPLPRLSPRELDVARQFAAGRTHREIAHELGLSPATVRNQLQSAYGKLGVRSKIELASRLRAAASTEAALPRL